MITLLKYLWASPQKSTTKSNRGKVKIDTTITVLNIVPELHFDYDLGNNHNMSVYYSGYTRQPSIYDLLSVPDYTNPLNITMGNPGLKPAFGQTIKEGTWKSRKCYIVV